MQGPLSGFRVVEVGMWVAGPSCAAVLGDWGADVVKLEDPGAGDPMRGATHARDLQRRPARRPGFELDNRNKRSVAVDLRNAEGPGLRVQDNRPRRRFHHQSPARRAGADGSRLPCALGAQPAPGVRERSTATAIADPIGTAPRSTTPRRGRARA